MTFDICINIELYDMRVIVAYSWFLNNIYFYYDHKNPFTRNDVYSLDVQKFGTLEVHSCHYSNVE